MSTEETPADGRGEVVADARLRNDLILDGAKSLGDEEDYDFFCECGDSSCKEVVQLTVPQYRVARFWPVLAHSSVSSP